MEKEYAVLIGYRIRQERVQRNISQPEMADILGISYSYYNNIEKGNRSCPIEVLIEICREFGISSDRNIKGFCSCRYWRILLEIMHEIVL